ILLQISDARVNQIVRDEPGSRSCAEASKSDRLLCDVQFFESAVARSAFHAFAALVAGREVAARVDSFRIEAQLRLTNARLVEDFVEIDARQRPEATEGVRNRYRFRRFAVVLDADELIEWRTDSAFEVMLNQPERVLLVLQLLGEACDEVGMRRER